MAIATKTQYWTSRMNGTNPAALTGTFNDSWSETGSGGAASGEYWRISGNGYWSQTPTTSDYTLVAALKFPNTGALPSDGTVLMRLDNGDYRVEVRAKGNSSTLDLVGASTATTPDLDLALADDNPVAVILRLTLDASGNARLYMREIIEDDDGATHFLSVTASSGSGKDVRWGNSSGTVDWGSVYYTSLGSFSPDELLTSDFAQDALVRMGLAIVDQIKNSTRMYLKTQVDNSSVIYGYDLSMDMLNRLSPPTVHVMIKDLGSPEFESLGGAKITQNYDVMIFVTTKGTNYENAYRLGLNIIGEIFDELYTNTGVEGTTDSIISYVAEFSPRMDNDDFVCVHRMELTYMRRIDMRHR
tara:strand:- start:1162 stop:2235 length:1074 start_codon:yes stop_codon:yes gene_type:complete